MVKKYFMKPQLPTLPLPTALLKRAGPFNRHHNHNNHKPSGTLRIGNIRIHDRRTSVRLRPEMWDALEEISRMEEYSIHDLCSAVSDIKTKNSSFSSELCVFIMDYYRSIAMKDNDLPLAITQARTSRAEGLTPYFDW